MKKNLVVSLGLFLAITAHALGSFGQISARNDVRVEIQSYRQNDADSLIENKAQLMQALEANGLSKLKIQINESYQRAWGRAMDRWSLRSGAGAPEEAARREVQRIEEYLRNDPQKIVIIYAPTYVEKPTLMEALKEGLGIGGADQIKERQKQRQQINEREPNGRAAWQIAKSIIEAVNSSPTQKLRLSYDNFYLVPSPRRLPDNVVLINVGSGVINPIQ